MAHGELYILNFKFTVSSMRYWTIEINGIGLRSLASILVDRSMRANLTLNQKLYGPPGDTPLRITVSRDNITKTRISKTICTRLLSNDFSVRVKKSGIQGKPVLFEIEKNNTMQAANVSIDFGDGTKKVISEFSSKNHNLWKTYKYEGTYTFKWHCYDKYKISHGRQTISITGYEAVTIAEKYLYPIETDMVWPNSTVSFHITSSCPYKPPTNAVYRINYGDGSKYTSWTKVRYYECEKQAKLPTHTYRSPGCYTVQFQIKNLLGFKSEERQISIDPISESLRLHLKNVPSLLSSSESIEAGGIVYLHDDSPIEAKVAISSTTCLSFLWSTSPPIWFKSTGNVNRIIMSHHAKSDIEKSVVVTVFGKGKTISKRKRVIISKPLRGLVLLLTDPNDMGQVFVYLLVKELGPSPQLTWAFGDGKFIKEKGLNFTTATSLPNIKNAYGSRKLDLASFKGLSKQHRYTISGSFQVVVKASDRFRELTAKSTVYVSDSTCSRPKVSILTQPGKGKLTFSIGETFTVQTYVEISCDDSSQSTYKWEIFSSSKSDMGSSMVAESNRKIE